MNIMQEHSKNQQNWQLELRPTVRLKNKFITTFKKSRRKMSSSFCTSYALNQKNEFTPINIVPSGAVRCSACGKEFPPDRLHEHLRTHVNPKYQKPFTTSSPTKKPNIFEVEDDTEQESIEVRSILPEELPSRDKKLKLQRVPGGTDIYALNQNLSEMQISARPDAGVEKGSIEISTEHEEKEDQEMLKYDKPIKVHSAREYLSKKEIHFYKNDKTQKVLMDKGGSVSKHRRQDTGSQLSQQTGWGYDMEPTERPDNNSSHFLIHTHRKFPKKVLHISTFSTAPRDHNESEDNDGSSVSPYDYDRTVYTDKRNHQCSACGGFYCSHCKSDIPPIYRPVPDQHGNYHLHPNEETTQWIKTHYYNNPEYCQKCEGPLQNKRQQQ